MRLLSRVGRRPATWLCIIVVVAVVGLARRVRTGIKGPRQLPTPVKEGLTESRARRLSVVVVGDDIEEEPVDDDVDVGAVVQPEDT